MSQFFSANNIPLLKKIIKFNKVSQDIDSMDDQKVIAEFVIDRKDRNDFSMERGPQSSGIKTLICKICGSDQFFVGQAEYFTAIKCETCGYELEIHVG